MSNNFTKYPLKQEQFKDFQALLFINSRNFKMLNFYFQLLGLTSFVQNLRRTLTFRAKDLHRCVLTSRWAFAQNVKVLLVFFR